MISTLDLLYVTLSIAILVFVGFFAFAAYNVAKTLQAMKSTITAVQATTGALKNDVEALHGALQTAIFGGLAKLLGNINNKGGEKTE